MAFLRALVVLAGTLATVTVLSSVSYESVAIVFNRASGKERV